MRVDLNLEVFSSLGSWWGLLAILPRIVELQGLPVIESLSVRVGEQIHREIEKEMITLVRHCWHSIASPNCIFQVSNTIGRRRSTWEIVSTIFFVGCKSSKYEKQPVTLV
jgi:hypothetical protein